MLQDKVFVHPGDEVVLKGALDHLVQKIRAYELMDIGAREVVGEGLTKNERRTSMAARGHTTTSLRIP